MRKLLLALVVIGVVAYFGKGVIDRYLGKGQPIGEARVRVTSMLLAMAEQPPDEQAAVSWWAEGVPLLDMDGLRRYDMPFGRFWRASGLAGGSGWRIENAVFDDQEFWILVSVVGGGGRVELAVRPRQPIRMADEVR